MTDEIDLSKYAASTRAVSGGRAESEDVSRHNHPERETRSTSEKELHPDYFRKHMMDEGRYR
jgi:hypothetical protein